MSKIPNKTINQRGQIQILEGKLELNGNTLIISVPIPIWAIPIPINLSNLVPILMGMPHFSFPCTSLV